MKDIMQSTKPWIEELMTAGYKVIVISEKIPSEMEVAPRYKLLTLLKLFTQLTVYTFNTPHFYHKYAHPFSEGSFLKILW